ncbi:MAG: hypothetical protein HFE85_04125 [Clostridiales bacterium]|nr:hypothetical protein [Clostridiales bacterium]
MVMECWAILIVLAGMFFIFLKSKRGCYSISILPLAIVPAMHLIGRVVSRQLDPLLPVSGDILNIGIDASAVVIACILLGFTSRNIPSKRQQKIFLVCCGAFVILLAWVLIIDIAH